MEEGRGRRRGRIVGLMVVAGLVGYMIGPPIVNAAASLVVIKDSGSKRKARVLKGGAVKVRPNGGFINRIAAPVQSIPIPTFGVDRFATGGEVTAEQACSAHSVVTEVVLEGGTSGSTVTLTGDTDLDGDADDVVWKGTVGASEHLADTFGSGVFSGGPLTVDAAGTDGEWFVYGFCADTFPLAPGRPSGR